jgi:hypothetical protein
MVKRRNVIFGVVVFLLIAAVVAVIVLAVLGDFKKKSPPTSSGPGKTPTFPYSANTTFDPVPNKVTCITPTIKSLLTSKIPLSVEISPSITNECVANLETMYSEEEYFKDGQSLGKTSIEVPLTAGMTSYVLKGPPTYKLDPGSIYSGTVRFVGNDSSIMAIPFNFKFNV